MVVTLERSHVPGPPDGSDPAHVVGKEPVSGVRVPMHDVPEREGGVGPLVVTPGQVVGLVGSAGSGMTRIGLEMLAAHAGRGTVACLDVRGWMSPLAAWEAGIPEDRLVVVRCEGPVEWARVGATLLEGVVAMYAEVPRGAKDAQLRTLATLARTRRSPLILRPIAGALPGGVTQLRLEAKGIHWEGTEDGHGSLRARRLVVEASGKVMRGMTRTIEVEDHGADALRVVSGLAAPASGRAVG